MENKEDSIATFAKGATTAISGKFIGRGLNFLSQVVLARVLGPEAFGLYAIGWNLLRLIGLIGPIGMDQGAIRFGSKYWKKDSDKFQTVYVFTITISLLSGLLIGLFLYFSASFVATKFFSKPGLTLVIQYFAFAIPFVLCLRVLANLSTVTKDMKYSILLEEIFQPALEIVLLIIFFIIGYRLSGAIIAANISFALSFVAGYFVLRRLFPNIVITISNSGSVIKEILIFSIPTSFAVLFGSLISWVDRLIVGLLLSEADTGVYATISLVSVLFVMILSGIKSIFSPMIAGLYANGEIKDLEELYRVSTKWGLCISIPPALVVFFASKELIVTFFGEQYAGGEIALIILVSAQLLNVGTGPLDLLLLMTGNNNKWLMITSVMIVFNVIVIFLLIPHFGIIGAAIGTALTVVIVFIVGVMVVKTTLNVWPFDQRLKKVLFAALITLVVMALLNLPGYVAGFPKLLLNALLAFICFGELLYLLGFENEDRKAFAMILSRIRRVIR